MSRPEPVYDVQVLHSATCPHVERTLEEVEAAIRAFKPPADRTTVRRVPLATEDDARLYGVSGSPTVRVNGEDVDHVSSRPHLACREYVDADHALVPYPPAFLVHAALRHAHQVQADFEREDGAELLPYTE